MKKMITFFLALCLLLSLAACGSQKDAGGDAAIDTEQTGGDDAAADAGQAGGDTADAQQPDDGAEEKEISGVVNRLGDYMVLLDDSGEYHIFDYGENVDPTTLAEGDSVKVTYTGTLDSEDPAPVAVAVALMS